MNKLRKFIMIIPVVLAVLLVEAMLIGIIVFYMSSNVDNSQVLTISEVTAQTAQEEFQLMLPCSFDDFKDDSMISLSFKINNRSNETMYFKSSYSSLKIFANDNLIYEYGKQGTIPQFLKDLF